LIGRKDTYLPLNMYLDGKGAASELAHWNALAEQRRERPPDWHLKALDGTPHRESAMSAACRAGKVITDAFLEAPNRPGAH
jgi:hypothetical protein